MGRVLLNFLLVGFGIWLVLLVAPLVNPQPLPAELANEKYFELKGLFMIELFAFLLWLAIWIFDSFVERHENKINEKHRHTVFAQEEPMEYVTGEVVDDSHLPLYARNRSNSLQLMDGKESRS